MPKTDIRGLKIDNITMAEAIEASEKVLSGGGKLAVFTPSAERAQA